MSSAGQTPACSSNADARERTLQDRVDRSFQGRFHVIRHVKSGSHGSVLECLRSDSFHTAIKEILTHEHDEYEGIPVHAIRELAAHKHIQRAAHTCPYILELLEFHDSFKNTFLVFPYVTHCLQNFVKKKAHAEFVYNTSEAQRTNMKREILSALDFLHVQNIMHRDVKPANILVTEDLHIKLCDFGLAKFCCKCNPEVRLRRHTVDVVTIWYRPLEILFSFEFYNHKIDIWAAGCTFFEIDYGRPLCCATTEIEMIFQIYKKVGTIKRDQPISYLQHYPDFQEDLFQPKAVINFDTLPNVYRHMLHHDIELRCEAAQAISLL